jgi:hypothetical protein
MLAFAGISMEVETLEQGGLRSQHLTRKGGLHLYCYGQWGPHHAK